MYVLFAVILRRLDLGMGYPSAPFGWTLFLNGWLFGLNNVERRSNR